MPSERVPLIAGNWKMHTTVGESRDLAGQIVETLGSADGYEVGLFPPATSLAAVAEVVAASPVASRYLVGAQNMHDQDKGAFTGEITAAMIRACGGNSVILGHSERRHVFGEDDEFVGRKVAAAVAAGITPILCVGETIDERNADQTMEVVGRHLQTGIAGLETAAQLAQVVIAYEPVWAIGTGLTATPDQAQEVHEFTRGALRTAFTARGGSEEQADATRILYGGSVKPENAEDLLGQADIDGALVGGASLKADSFAGICAGA